MDNFTQLKDLLPRAIAKYGVSREVRAAFVCDRTRNAITTIWGNEGGIRPLYFKDGVITVEVDNSALAQDVFMRKGELINMIESSEVLSGSIKDVRARVSG